MGLTLTYLGHATAMVESEAGTRVLIDPWIDENPGCPYKVDTLPRPDLVLVSHAAWDHRGDVLKVLERFPEASLFCARDVRAWAKRKGVAQERIKVMVWGFCRQESDLTITAVETHHGSFLDDGDMVYNDVCLGFVIADRSGASLYHMADTSIFSDLKLIGELHNPKVTLVPVGSAPGAHPEMSTVEAAMAAQWAAPGLAVPIHYMPGDQDHLVNAWRDLLIRRSPDARTRIMHPGDTLRISGAGA